jgi:hypothetical protein
MIARRARLLEYCVAALLSLAGTVILAPASATADESTSDVTATETWCLSPENGRHVAAVADVYGSAIQRGENVKVGENTLTVEEWSQRAESDFEAACDRAFSLYGPDVDSDSSSDEEWLIPLLGALGGTAVGAGAAHFSSALRDRKLWIREDTAMIRRLSIEVRSASQEAEEFNAKSPDGGVVYARLGRVASDLGAILNEATLDADDAALDARGKVDRLIDELGKPAPTVSEVKSLGSAAGELARDNAAAWADKMHPRPRLGR